MNSVEKLISRRKNETELFLESSKKQVRANKWRNPKEERWYYEWCIKNFRNDRK